MATDTTTYKVYEPVANMRPILMMEKEIDFAVTPAVQNDIWEIFDLPKDSVVIAFELEIITQCTAALDVSVGVGAGTEISTAIDMDQAAGTTAIGTHSLPVLFNDDSVDIKFINAAGAAGKFRMRLAYLDMSPMMG